MIASPKLSIVLTNSSLTPGLIRKCAIVPYMWTSLSLYKLYRSRFTLLNQKRRLLSRLLLIHNWLCRKQLFHPANDHDHFTFDLQRLTLLDEDRFHGRVGGLKTIAILFLEEILQGRFVIARQPDGNHFTIACIAGGPEDHNITII